MKSDSHKKLRGLVLTALMAAVICVVSPFSVPTPMGVPLSLATAAVYFSGALLGKYRSVAAVAVYLLIGLVGLPVFSGFSGGAAILLGITGGYLIGYIPCAFLTGLFAERSGGKPIFTAVGMTLGTLALYAFGTAWFVMFTGSDFLAAVMAGVVPFLIGDAAKIAAACLVSTAVRKKLPQPE